MRLRHHFDVWSDLLLEWMKSTILARFPNTSPNGLSYLCRLFTSIDDCADRFKNSDYLWHGKKRATWNDRVAQRSEPRKGCFRKDTRTRKYPCDTDRGSDDNKYPNDVME